MDQLHEELKQPVDSDMNDCGQTITPSTSSTTESTSSTVIINEAPKEPVKEKGTDVSEAPRVVETNSHSDTDYETCDSGMSSERSSMGNSLSGDEAIEEADSKTSQHQAPAKTKPRNAGGRNKRDKNRVNPETNEIVTSASGIRLENKPDHTGDSSLTSRHSGGSVAEASKGVGTDVDSGEFSDAVSELEPLQSQRLRSAAARSRHVSDCEKGPKHNHMTHVLSTGKCREAPTTME